MINPFILETHKERLINDAVINLKFSEENHKYTSKDFNQFVSITTILKEMGITPNYDVVDEEVLNRAIDYGKLIHKEIENYCKLEETGITHELEDFIKWSKSNKLNYVASEYIVHNEKVAGTIDLIYRQNNELVISDIKTTSQVHKEAVSWQLSLYRYLLKENIEKATCIHIRPDKFEVIEIPLKSNEECEELLNCYFNNTRYEIAILEQNKINKLVQSQNELKVLQDKQKEIENTMKSIKEMCLQEMDKRGLIKVEIKQDDTKLLITKVESKQTSVDMEKLKQDHPEIDYDNYTKTTYKKPFIKITCSQ